MQPPRGEAVTRDECEGWKLERPAVRVSCVAPWRPTGDRVLEEGAASTLTPVSVLQARVPG